MRLPVQTVHNVFINRPKLLPTSWTLSFKYMAQEVVYIADVVAFRTFVRQILDAGKSVQTPLPLLMPSLSYAIFSLCFKSSNIQ